MLWLPLLPVALLLTAAWIDLEAPTRNSSKPNGSRFGLAPYPRTGGPVTLKPLPYPYEALEPALSSEIVRLHHDANQASYVRGANEALSELRRLDEDMSSMPDALRRSIRYALSKDLAFSGAGVVLHELYWENLSPHGGGEPSGAFRRQIERDFGSVPAFLRAFDDLALATQGSGWVVAAFWPRAGRIVLLPVEDHQKQIVPGSVALLVCDLWEHAWALQYPADRGAYMRAFWSKVDWDEVSRRFEPWVRLAS